MGGGGCTYAKKENCASSHVKSLGFICGEEVELIWIEPLSETGILWKCDGVVSEELAKHISLAAATISSLLTIFIDREKFMSGCLATILDFLRHLAVQNKFSVVEKYQHQDCAKFFLLLKNINIKILCIETTIHF